MKRAARSKAPTTIAQDDIEQSLLVLSARRQFLTTSLNMGWQLAFTVLLPVIIGVKLDDYFNTSPSYTLAALFLAIAAASAVVWQTITRVNREQAESEGKRKKA
jgi:F0F1-type ATP synthase assembly protein I